MAVRTIKGILKPRHAEQGEPNHLLTVEGYRRGEDSGSRRMGIGHAAKSGAGLRAAVRAHGEPRQHGDLPESELADREGELARDTGRLRRDPPSAFGWDDQPRPRGESDTLPRSETQSGGMVA